MMAIRGGVTVRGASNRNDRGNNIDRRRRKERLMASYRADVDTLPDDKHNEPHQLVLDALMGSGIRLKWASVEMCWIVPLGHGNPSCRCYRCGRLLTIETMTVDRIVPGCKGGRYVDNNVRPACGDCNSEVGGGLRSNR